MNSQYELLYKKLKEKDNSYDFEKIKNAFEFAYKSHDGQLRKSGEPYIIHPIDVAIIVADLELDTDSICAALLHDVIEDCDVTFDEIKKLFGEDVANLVDGVTKLGLIPYSSKEEQQIENLRKMFLAMAKDIRVILIKLSDRLHNMRTLEFTSKVKQQTTALETMEVYAPLAHRLGVQKIKFDLEDLSLKYLDPIGYEEITKGLEDRNIKQKQLVEEVKSQISHRLEEVNIKFFITGRVKHKYSIYRKLYAGDKIFDEIYDLYAVRIIVDNVTDCYSVLGNIHDMYNPIPGRFKDYISTPKPNMYQSLHTTVIGKAGVPFEVQIRTWEMHKIAEYGIAAHWKYKDGLSGKDSMDNKLEWVRHLLEIEQNTTDGEEFVKNLKVDLFADQVFIFTPKGDVVNLPNGSNIIDFAYSIHSAVGNKMVAAKVNGKIVGLEHELQNGEIVEIITTRQENHGPSRSWIKLVKTTEARSKIRAWFKKEKREENIETGKEEFYREVKRAGVYIDEDEKEEFLNPIFQKYHCDNMDEFYAAIGYGGILISKLIPKLRDMIQKKEAQSSSHLIPISKPTKRSVGGVSIEGVENCLVKFAKCCNPLPGDDIIGFITKGYGVSVHKKSCVNIINFKKDEENKNRLVPVYWDDATGKSFNASIFITAEKHIGLVAEVTSAIAGLHVMILSLNVREDKDGLINISLTVEVNNKKHLSGIINKLLGIKGIYKVERT